MDIDGHEVTSDLLRELIGSVKHARWHWEATKHRADNLRLGGTAPTILAQDETQIFAFGPDLETAQYLAAIDPWIDWNSIDESFKSIEELPTITWLDKAQSRLQVLTKQRGLLDIFRRKPTAEIDVYRQLRRIDTDAIQQILSGIDALMGSTPRGRFNNLRLDSRKTAIKKELEQTTRSTVTWISSAELGKHAKGAKRLAEAQSMRSQLTQRVEEKSKQLRKFLAKRIVAQTDINILDDITESRLRLNSLHKLSIQEISQSTPAQLKRYDGVGDITASQAIAAARSYIASVEKSQVPVIDYRDKKPSTSYVRALADLLVYEDRMRTVPTRTPMLIPDNLLHREAELLALAEPKDSTTLLTDKEIASIPSSTQLHHKHSAEEAWSLYAIRAADFHAYGDTSAGTTVPEDIAESIEKISLAGTMHANLRGYQAFGAKFAIAQRKTLIGDEMGLGKTVQALCVFTHLQAKGKTHFLVICPPSLRLNWEREVKKFTDFPVHVIAGPDKEAFYQEFCHEGGIGIVGYPEVRGSSTVMSDAQAFDALVVDEAHRAKNPDSLQSQGVQKLTQATEFVVYLTGTPLENRVAEMETLLSYLDPSMTGKLKQARRTARGFQNAVARIYLRRNQGDVLSELPPLVVAEEWIEPTELELKNYEAAVADSQFMDMRQAFSGASSAKMDRLQDLLADGMENDKTIVFTYFRSVLDSLQQVFSDHEPGLFGPIAGGVSQQKRQEELDSFTAAPPGALLIAQINAANEGLSIQAANHVVIFEPQLNPAVEAQAIGRAHRMGQIDRVKVHRLLTPNTVEEQLHNLLAAKRAVFDSYARPSVTAQSTPEAVDVTSSELIKQVLESEQQRLKKIHGETPQL